MKVKDYVEIIEKTSVFPDTVSNFGVAYSFIGMLDEYSELLETFTVFKDLHDKGQVNYHDRLVVLAEAGDVLWYLTALSKETGVPYSEVFAIDKTLQVDVQALYRIVFSKIGGDVKKFYRDDKEIDTEKFASVLNYCYNCLCVISSFAGLEMADVREYNYNKLMKRRETDTLHGDGDYREKE